uniref:Uncharacterized protein n=1 Tax=Corethron hystrix TaxID=216773 RepID=A0A7S1BCE5_9STRA|mmetsp:Transcript_21844/g.49690  ORF Transcript_21844/g.49690 Transcript_21844/m.49690 type:complete len:546 (+) Transcript_21844:258-1895(+)
MFFSRVICFLASASVSDAAWQIRKDEGIKNRDITPVLGRGYSITTGSFHSICLEVDEIADPTCDYEFFFEEIQSEAEITTSLKGKFSDTVSAEDVVNKISRGYAASGTSNTNTHYLVSLMRIEKYFSSVDESESGFIEQMDAVFDRGNIMQFFQVCGPTYIQAINRITEVSATFSYTSGSSQADVKFNNKIEQSFKNSDAVTASSSTEGALSSSADNLTINIQAYGIGLGDLELSEDESFVASNMEDFTNLMDVAFQSIADPYVGLVLSMEVVPWISSPLFMNTFGLDNTLSRNTYGCIDAGDATCNSTICGYDATTGAELFNKDRCIVTGDEDSVNKDIRKFNLQANAEYIVRLDARVRDELSLMHRHMNCISKLFSMDPEVYDLIELHSNTLGFNFDRRDSGNSVDLTVQALKFKLLYGEGFTPSAIAQDPSVLTPFLFVRKWQHISDYITLFMEPCMNQLSDEHFGTQNANMQLKHWSTITECNKYWCTMPGTLMANGTCHSMAATQGFKDYNYLGYWLEEYCPPRLKSSTELNPLMRYPRP